MGLAAKTGKRIAPCIFSGLSRVLSRGAVQGGSPDCPQCGCVGPDGVESSLGPAPGWWQQLVLERRTLGAAGVHPGQLAASLAHPFATRFEQGQAAGPGSPAASGDVLGNQTRPPPNHVCHGAVQRCCAGARIMFAIGVSQCC